MTEEYKELFVDEEEPKRRIVSAIEPYMKFTPSGQIVYEEAYTDLTAKQKTLLHLLSTKVLVSQDLREKEGMNTQELADKVGVAVSTIEGYVYGSVERLVESNEGHVVIPNHKVKEVTEELRGEIND